MSADELGRVVDVSRETRRALRHYAETLSKWNARINLVGPATLGGLWRRHVLDSAQLWPLVTPGARSAVDFGSGAGFPAVVLALIARDQGRNLSFALVECDRRKAAFLATVARELDLPLTIRTERLEKLAAPAADLVTARAFAPLPDLVSHAARLRQPEGQALFPKGRTVHKELDEAGRLWNFDYRLHPSLTDPEAAVVEIGAIHGPR